jgi:Immunoglobulin I-set domain
VKIIYDNRDVTQKTITFDPKKGEHELAIKCLVDGSVKEPKIEWTFDVSSIVRVKIRWSELFLEFLQGKTLNALTKDDIAIEDHSLTLLKPSHHNSGVYHCVANPKTGKPNAFVTIHVKRKLLNSKFTT